MFERIDGAQEQLLRTYLSLEPAMNLFLQGDLENFGLDGEIFTVFANVRPDGSWDSIACRYRKDFIVYSTEDSFDVDALVDFLKEQPAIRMISGKYSIVSQLANWYPSWRLRDTTMCRCTELLGSDVDVASATVRKLGAGDADAMFDLLVSIPEFASAYTGRGRQAVVDEIVLDLTQTGMGYGAFVEGQLVCSAYTSAQCSTGAMVIGVGTDIRFRHRGLARAVVRSLCRQNFLEERQFLSLFYNNPDAGRIYLSIGFVPVGQWGMLGQ